MTGPMFRKRSPKEGSGYAIASRTGGYVAAGFVVLIMALPLGLAVWFEGQEWSVYAGGALVLALLFGFIRLVISHSDAPKDER